MLALMSQTGSRWVSRRKPVAGEGSAPQPAPPAVATQPSGAAVGEGGALVHQVRYGMDGAEMTERSPVYGRWHAHAPTSRCFTCAGAASRAAVLLAALVLAAWAVMGGG